MFSPRSILVNVPGLNFMWTVWCVR